MGTDGYGRSDCRAELRHFFEVDRYNIAYAALYALYRRDQFSLGELTAARESLGIDPAKSNRDPWHGQKKPPLQSGPSGCGYDRIYSPSRDQ